MRHFIPFILLAVAITACTSVDDRRAWEHITPGIFVDELARSQPSPRGPLRDIPAQGTALTQQSEGFIPKPYDDAAHYCTIAYGHLIKFSRCDGSEPPEWRRGITIVEGTTILISDMRIAQAAVLAATPDSVILSDGQYAALCDFVFNVGKTNYMQSTLRAEIDSGQLRDVARQFRRWNKAGGRVLSGLVQRREREIAIFFSGLPDEATLSRAGAALREADLIDIRRGETPK